ncbi:MAG: beta-propeller fold lactonase family protein [Desulfovibrio sp.]|jgi:YVTN family beta-propeller protein|nr:beta-propeller fold lactonase family protein [Desulfovibrio sp.]
MPTKLRGTGAFALTLLLAALLTLSAAWNVQAADSQTGVPAIAGKTPEKDPYIIFASGGISGTVEVIGLPSLRTLKLIPIGVDTHEPVFSGTNSPGTNGTPDGKYLYINDKGDSAVGIVDIATLELIRKINIPAPFGPHHIAITPDGKTLFATGELSGKMAKIDIASGKVDVIDVSEGKESAPDYLVVTHDGKYCLATDYYRSGVHVIDVPTFKHIKFIPAGKNPHGIDITIDGKQAWVAGKLSGNIPIIDIAKLEVVKEIDLTPAVAGFPKSPAPGPLHTVFTGDGKWAYTTLFVDNAVAKINVATQEVVKKIPVHYRPGHLQITPDSKYIAVFNKYSTGLFAGSTSNQDPTNVELIDLEKEEVIARAPTVPEPHNAKIIKADAIVGYLDAKLPPEGYAALYAPHKDPKVVARLIPEDKGAPGVTKTADGVVEVRLQEFSYGFKPDTVTVKKGDKVRVILTNIDKATGLTNDPAPVHGFIINEYGQQTNWGVPQGKSVVFEFTADKVGKFAMFCSYFCGPLHLEMRGWFIVEA